MPKVVNASRQKTPVQIVPASLDINSAGFDDPFIRSLGFAGVLNAVATGREDAGGATDDAPMWCGIRQAAEALLRDLKTMKAEYEKVSNLLCDVKHPTSTQRRCHRAAA